MFKHLKPYLAPYRKEFIVGPSFKLLEAIFELTLPVMMANIIDIGIANRDKSYIFRTGIWMFLAILVGLGSALICQYSAAVASQGFGTRLRSALFSHINRLSMADLDALGTDTLTTRVTNDINQLQVAVAMMIRLVTRAPFVSLGCVVAAMLIDLPLSAVIWTGVISFIVVLTVIMLTAFPLYAQVQVRLDGVGSVVRGNFAGVRVIRAFARGAAERERFLEAVDRHAQSVIRVARVSSLMNPLTSLIMNLVICAILWFGGMRVDTGGMTTGEVIAFINYIAQILTALIAVANLVVIFTKAAASLQRVNEVLDREPAREAAAREDWEAADREVPAVSFSHVSFSYVDNPEKDPEKNALTDIDFSVPQGGLFGIIGGTGSGKTTILSLIARFYDAQAGSISLFGTDVGTLPADTVREKLGLVFQAPRLFSGTVAENLRWGDPEAPDFALQDACVTAQAEEFIKALPQKYDTWIEREGRNLSGGQKQRLSIARALVRRPPILLLDDASSALDFTTEAKLRQALAELQQKTKMTIIIVSQRISSIRNAGQILVLDDGRQAGLGNHGELMGSCEAYRAIACSQTGEKEVG